MEGASAAGAQVICFSRGASRSAREHRGNPANRHDVLLRLLQFLALGELGEGYEHGHAPAVLLV